MQMSSIAILSLLLVCFGLARSQFQDNLQLFTFEEEALIEEETEIIFSGGFLCTILEECQQRVQQLELRVQNLKNQLDASQEEGGMTVSDDGIINAEFTTSNLGLNYYNFELPSTGTFYVWVPKSSRYFYMYLSSTCDCNSPFTAIPPTRSHYCRASRSGLSETTSKKCTVYYTIYSPYSVLTVRVRFLHVTTLPLETKTLLDFPYFDSYLTFTQHIKAQDTPTTLYISAFETSPSSETYIAIGVTSDCDDSCKEGPSFTQFPKTIGSSYCWKNYTSFSDSPYATTFSLRITEECNVYYSITSVVPGKSVEVILTIYHTTFLENNTLSTVNFPVMNNYRTFYQDLNPQEAFYITAFEEGQGTAIDIYATSNCTQECVESLANTVFPNNGSFCWQGVTNFDFEADDAPCRVYYSLLSAGDAIRARVLVYPLQELPRDVYTLVYFPTNRSYRWFYADINEIGIFQIDVYTTDSTVPPAINVSHNCTSSCLESYSFTEHPTSSANCWLGLGEFTLDLSNTNLPCRVYYSLFSSELGDKLNVKTTLNGI